MQVSYYSHRIHSWIHGKVVHMNHEAQLCTVQIGTHQRVVPFRDVYVNDPLPTFIPLNQKIKSFEYREEMRKEIQALQSVKS